MRLGPPPMRARVGAASRLIGRIQFGMAAQVHTPLRTTIVGDAGFANGRREGSTRRVDLAPEQFPYRESGSACRPVCGQPRRGRPHTWAASSATVSRGGTGPVHHAKNAAALRAVSAPRRSQTKATTRRTATLLAPCLPLGKRGLYAERLRYQSVGVMRRFRPDARWREMP